MFALCSLLRHFPYAQQQFLKLGGLQVLKSLVQQKSTEVLAVRVITLLYDLVTEKVSTPTYLPSPPPNTWFVFASGCSTQAIYPDG